MIDKAFGYCMYFFGGFCVGGSVVLIDRHELILGSFCLFTAISAIHVAMWTVRRASEQHEADSRKYFYSDNVWVLIKNLEERIIDLEREQSQ